MKTSTFYFIALFITAPYVSAQVGINTQSPQTTMDISAKRNSGGVITDNTQLIGLQAPRLTRAELTSNTATYANNQQGALIYITDISGGTATGQRINIDTIGYYYFDGSLWQKVTSSPVNIYNTNGSLTGNRTLTLNGSALNFTGTNEKTAWVSDGRLTQNNLLNSGGQASMSFYGGNNSNLFIQQFNNNNAQIYTTNNSTGFNIGTHATSTSAPLIFVTSAGGGALSTEKMRITGEGNVGVNTVSPTERLDNSGITRLRTLPLNGATNAIFTTSSGDASAAQDQTFTATRTVVADANGVLGYVSGLPAAASNIYNTNGTLTGTRTLSQAGFPLTFTNVQRTVFNNTSTLGMSQDSGTSTRSSISLSNGGTNQLFIFSDTNNASQFVASNTSTQLVLGTTATNSPAPITFLTSTGSNAVGSEKMRITPAGNIGIGTSNPNSKIQVTSGDVYIDTIGSGIILKAPNGNCFRVTVNNVGSFTSAAITCP